MIIQKEILKTVVDAAKAALASKIGVWTNGECKFYGFDVQNTIIFESVLPSIVLEEKTYSEYSVVELFNITTHGGIEAPHCEVYQGATAPPPTILNYGYVFMTYFPTELLSIEKALLEGSYWKNKHREGLNPYRQPYAPLVNYLEKKAARNHRAVSLWEGKNENIIKITDNGVNTTLFL